MAGINVGVVVIVVAVEGLKGMKSLITHSFYNLFT